ncbi:hypothetical protein AVEN_259409-1, partial [Araneus ventricosus]
ETPKLFYSINNYCSVTQLWFFYSLPDGPRRHVESSRTFKRISSPNRDIEKRLAFPGIFELSPRSPNLSPRSVNELIFLKLASCLAIEPKDPYRLTVGMPLDEIDCDSNTHRCWCKHLLNQEPRRKLDENSMLRNGKIYPDVIFDMLALASKLANIFYRRLD